VSGGLPPGRAQVRVLLAMLLMAVLPGCGKRGDPLAPLPKTPVAVKEVSVPDETSLVSVCPPLFGDSGDEKNPVSAVWVPDPAVLT